MNYSATIDACGAFFRASGLDRAVVGWSGGIDSCTTALLCRAAGIETHLVVAEAPNQRYSSKFGGFSGAVAMHERFPGLKLHRHEFQYPFAKGMDASNEAALPILRLAIFYGVAAALRVEDGAKPVVVGTANFSEAAFLGFWGKSSDAAQDYYPISHFTKAEVYLLARHLGAPQEIIDAVPSGDLLFEETNDHLMIGATYAQIEEVIACAENGTHIHGLMEAMWAVDDPVKFANNIVRNAFKYELPFPGFHMSTRLERFRMGMYGPLLSIAKGMINA